MTYVGHFPSYQAKETQSISRPDNVSGFRGRGESQEKTVVEPSGTTGSGVTNYSPFNLKTGTDSVAEKKWFL
jgi:hypothetical protein